MPLTPEDVRNKQFTTVRLREGYDEDEVDAFLDEVESELTRLLRENEDLRAKLAAATRAAAQNQQGMRKPEQQDRPVPAAISGPQPVQQQMPQQQMPQQQGGMPQLPPGPSAQQHGPGPGQHPMQQQGPGPMGQHPMQQQGPGPMGQHPMQQGPGPMGQHPMQQQGHPMQQQGPGGDSAARVLSLAQQTADQAIAEARSEANKIVGEARSRAEGLERDARAKADALERDAQEKHRVAMGSLESARATLERKVEDLRGFEREYRTRLKSYLESQLRQLENQADDSLAPPRTTPSAPSLPSPSPMGGTMGGSSMGNGSMSNGMSGMAPAGAGAMGHSASAPSYGGGQGMGGHTPGPTYGGQQQMSPAMTQPMAPVRPQGGPSPLQQAPTPMRGFLIDEDDN
ncbi:DivIVA domain-containing protein [Actinacidiphila bryophytorum]|uniref:Cell wall synthesis protein Wag31 n=2 Tax=Actinacidiphila bryophytorum TaxID=1436133 RepID=A0A9W4GZF0_9ACTN|nr:DivIVA domain-containing protein [Actinacidiphila bryophytorum]MBM9436247.1 DivIVA domain-containing protein [Actinacidiphila bryophytorum]CAG7632655.1 Antigen 84 [Actinacidiphila bryophytorum]